MNFSSVIQVSLQCELFSPVSLSPLWASLHCELLSLVRFAPLWSVQWKLFSPLWPVNLSVWALPYEPFHCELSYPSFWPLIKIARHSMPHPEISNPIHLLHHSTTSIVRFSNFHIACLPNVSTKQINGPLSKFCRGLIQFISVLIICQGQEAKHDFHFFPQKSWF